MLSISQIVSVLLFLLGTHTNMCCKITKKIMPVIIIIMIPYLLLMVPLILLLISPIIAAFCIKSSISLYQHTNIGFSLNSNMFASIRSMPEEVI